MPEESSPPDPDPVPGVLIEPETAASAEELPAVKPPDDDSTLDGPGRDGRDDPECADDFDPPAPDDGADELEPAEPAEPAVSAKATGIDAIAAPTPNATASAPTRPTLLALLEKPDTACFDSPRPPSYRIWRTQT